MKRETLASFQKLVIAIVMMPEGGIFWAAVLIHLLVKQTLALFKSYCVAVATSPDVVVSSYFLNR
jgi:hypothetical protein